jgi:hypothetical protein
VTVARRKKLGSNPLAEQASLPNVVERIVSDRSDTPSQSSSQLPDDATLGAEFLEEVAAKTKRVGRGARVQFVPVRSAELVQFDGEDAVDRLIATPLGALAGAIVKVAPVMRAAFRDAFDAGMVAQSARDRGAIAVIVTPRVIPDARMDDAKAEAVRRALTPRDAIAAWFGELAGLTEEERAACIDAADDLMAEDER